MNYNSISGNCTSYPMRLTDFFIGELGSDAYERQICLVDGYELHTIGLVQVYYLMSDIYLGTEDKLFAYIYLADHRLGADAVLQGLKNNDLFEIFDEHYSRDLQTVKQFDISSLDKLPKGLCSRSAVRGYLGVLKMFYHETLRLIGQVAIKPGQARQLGKVEDSIIHLYDLLGTEAESDPSWIYFKCRKDHRDIQSAGIKSSGPRIPFSMSYQGYYKLIRNNFMKDRKV